MLSLNFPRSQTIFIFIYFVRFTIPAPIIISQTHQFHPSVYFSSDLPLIIPGSRNSPSAIRVYTVDKSKSIYVVRTQKSISGSLTRRVTETESQPSPGALLAEKRDLSEGSTCKLVVLCEYRSHCVLYKHADQDRQSVKRACIGKVIGKRVY